MQLTRIIHARLPFRIHYNNPSSFKSLSKPKFHMSLTILQALNPNLHFVKIIVTKFSHPWQNPIRIEERNQDLQNQF